jgi:hypothetical protein
VTLFLAALLLYHLDQPWWMYLVAFAIFTLEERARLDNFKALRQDVTDLKAFVNNNFVHVLNRLQDIEDKTKSE